MPHQHPHGHPPACLEFAVITASDSRDVQTDESGGLICKRLAAAGHRVAHYEIVPDDPRIITATVQNRLTDSDGVIISGGTGIAIRDLTIEAVRPLLDKELDGFGELFRMLSYNEIGAAAFLSRALAGISQSKIVVALPGSPEACRLAMDKLLIPELGHMAQLLKS
ncbi:MAG: MogA/MoaB family molybdenum cofactor biosynthesis protein [Candidatus Binataceae bacterium]